MRGPGVTPARSPVPSDASPLPTRSEAATPRAAGFAVPSDADPHAATWTAWPHGEARWEGMLGAVRTAFAAFAAAVTRFEPLVLLVANEAVRRDAREHLRAAGAATEAVHLLEVPYDDVWLRDQGPTFLRGADATRAILDARFDGWGGRYPSARDAALPARVAEALGVRRFAADLVLEGGAVEMASDGTVLATRTSLLGDVRNPGWDAARTEAALRDQVGAERVVWLEGGLVDDHTDGHVDTVARFVGPDAVALVVPDADDAANGAAARANRAALAAAATADGRPYAVHALPLPLDRRPHGGVRPPRTYANFVLVNGGLLMPTYGDPRDDVAADVLAAAFPDRTVVGVPADALVTGGGAWHCVSTPEPFGRDGVPLVAGGAP
ncbi:MAG: agmatine deiminase family protein [Trueperaceae bacterium]|nr:agmatine deiminase family protein [Trueperaceae bacterium]